MDNVPNIDDVVQPTHDEHSRQRFVSVLRKHVLTEFAADVRTVYDKRAAPRFTRKHGRAPKTGLEIRKEMKDEPAFQEWIALMQQAQYMTWWSVQPAIERRIPELVQVARAAAAANPTGGSLRLDPSVEIPKTVTELDVHLMPGCFHTEHVTDDVAQGALYHFGTQVFSGGLSHRLRGGWGATTAQFLKIRYPHFRPAKYLDLGCTVGREMFSIMDAFPAAETFAVDVAAPALRYAHARAQALGKTVHFSQQNAERLDFPDNSFDLVTTSFLSRDQRAIGAQDRQGSVPRPEARRVDDQPGNDAGRRRQGSVLRLHRRHVERVL